MDTSLYPIPVISHYPNPFSLTRITSSLLLDRFVPILRTALSYIRTARLSMSARTDYVQFVLYPKLESFVWFCLVCLVFNSFWTSPRQRHTAAVAHARARRTDATRPSDLLSSPSPASLRCP
eukprot:6194770-Pleurochrysis_carterae.AAC.1